MVLPCLHIFVVVLRQGFMKARLALTRLALNSYASFGSSAGILGPHHHNQISRFYAIKFFSPNIHLVSWTLIVSRAVSRLGFHG